MLCIIDNFNKAWHERVEVESSTDNDIILNKKSCNKRSKLSSSSESDNEGINIITYEYVTII